MIKGLVLKAIISAVMKAIEKAPDKKIAKNHEKRIKKLEQQAHAPREFVKCCECKHKIKEKK
tara:strand:+ start:417 stop:602 length:186 start_codon:yes stop_codon:yes gene_type:complete